MIKFVTGVVVVFLVIFGLFKLWSYWDQINNDKVTEQRQSVANAIVPEQLAGLPNEYEPALRAAQSHGIAGMKEWLRTYGKVCEDPRRGWIELDYVVLISRDEPAEARRLFAVVKGRTPETSPIYPRIKQLEKTYQ